TIKNLLNWSHPAKTAKVYGALFLVWVVLLLIPGRYILLALGIHQFSAHWRGPAKEPDGPDPTALRIGNLLASLPTDLDLHCSALQEGWGGCQASAAEGQTQGPGSGLPVGGEGRGSQ
ncbi:unnamed protein product, partial [Discosporangium mesarthrocarpum]